MPGPVGGIDIDALVAIDIHTHAEVSAVTGRGSLAPELERAADEYFGIRDRQRPTVEQMASYYRERRMMAVVFTVDATTAMGVPPVPTTRSPRPLMHTPTCSSRSAASTPTWGVPRSGRSTAWSTN